MDELTVLIVEDESLVALELSSYITNQGFHVVDYVTTPQMARETLQKESINLILMDINLRAEIDGIDLYKSLNIDIPIIYLTAYQDERSIEKAVRTNPLGYLIKPYNENELLALLKIASYKVQNSDTILNIGEGYFYNTQKDKLYFNELYIKLSAQEMALLKLLVQANGDIVSFNTIENEIWPDSVPSPSSVRTLIYRLRGKLQYKLITTQQHQGIKIQSVKSL